MSRFYLLEVLIPPEECYYRYVNGIDSDNFIFFYETKEHIELLFFTPYYKDCLYFIDKFIGLSSEGLSYVPHRELISAEIKPCVKIKYRCYNKIKETKEIMKKMLADFVSNQV